MHGGKPVMDNPKRRRRSRRRSNPAGQYQYTPSMSRQGLLDNPSYSGLFENPMGAYSKDSLMAFGVAAAGVGLGLLIARATDRFIATMKPADSKSGNKANHPWYGKNAVMAINRRPGAMRLGVQAGGAVLAIGGAYALRNKAVAPWLLGGLALGFGSNLLLQFAEWYAIPWLLKIKDANEQTIQNRLYVLEQVDTQDKVDAIMEDWQTKPALAANQDQNAPVIMGPLNDASSPDVATLGRGAAGSRPSRPAMVGAARRFVPDGRVGNCDECGGSGGHYSGCGQCATCNGGEQKCAYTVMPGDDLAPVLEETGMDINVIAGLNGGGSPESWWLAGNRVILPEAVCHAVTRGAAQRRSSVAGIPPEAPPVEQPALSPAPAPSIPARSPVPSSVAFALAGGADE